MGELFVIVISSMLVSNVVLSQFLGICPFLGVSKKVETAAGMGAAVTFVITIACIITYPVQKCILEPFGFLISIVIMAGIRERIEHNDVPNAFKGTPIVLVTASLMAIAFCGFAGLV